MNVAISLAQSWRLTDLNVLAHIFHAYN